LTPKLYVGVGQVLFIGAVDVVPEHRGIVPKFAAGLDRPFRINVEGDVQVTRSLFLAAGLSREVNAYGGRLAVLLLDPDLAVVSPWNEAAVLENLHTLADAFDLDAWRGLSNALGLPQARTQLPDPVARAAELIANSSDENLSAQSLAAQLGLSVSRLEHLFTEHIGAPLRSYRLWIRCRNAAQLLANGGSLTDAALSAGFYDSAHFSNAFKRAFGMPPSMVFAPGVRPYVLGAKDVSAKATTPAD
jgi:AraC-like DNA-binding protein